MKGKAYFLLILTFIFLSRFLVFPRVSLWAATEASEAVSATVKISVCGNDIKEGGEDCDHADLNDQTCESIGYGPGTLACQDDCSFDVSGCGPAPTATPTPTVTPTPTPTPTTAATATSAPGPTATPGPEPTATPTPIVVTVMEILPLPAKVATFDIDGDGQIAVEEIKEAVELWVKEWRKEFKKEEGGVAPLAEEKKEEKEVIRGKPKNLLERLWPFGREEEVEVAEELPLVVVQEEKRGVVGAVRFWMAQRLGMAEPETVSGPPAEETLQSKLEKALETEEEKSAPLEEKKCDINKDEECNLIDFSVLMYYINS